MHDTAAFVAQVETMRAQKPGALALFGMQKDGEAIKYLVNVHHDFAPLFVHDATGLAAIERPVYVMINDKEIGVAAGSAEGENILTKTSLVFTGRFDSRSFSVFYLRP